MTEEERDMTDEEIEKSLEPILARAGAKMQRYMKERRNKFLQESQEKLRRLGAKEENMDSDGW